MRYDKTARFIKEQIGDYNKETGNYEDSSLLVRLVPVSVSPMSVSNAQVLLGDLRIKAITVRSLRKINFDFDYIEIERVKYRVEARVTYRSGDIFTCSEVSSER